ncbi:MAG: prolipoprotein diacylglyceryl transferase [Bacilli bacterium]|nr:prolipoprotein diacylglyceryl transferase [Bacilli bacterium]
MINTKIPLYGILVVTGILSGLYIMYKNVKTLNYKKEENYGLILYILLGTLFGAKYFTLLTNFNKFKDNIDFKKIGLSSYGAIIGILILLIIFAKQYKKNFKDLINNILPAIPLMYGISKIGCFLAGCCYGIKYNGPLSITYKYSLSAPKNISLLPIQKIETKTLILIYLYISKKKKENKNIIGITILLCGLSKFLLDYLRMNHINKILTVNQIVSIPFIIIGLILYFKEKSEHN